MKLVPFLVQSSDTSCRLGGEEELRTHRADTVDGTSRQESYESYESYESEEEVGRLESDRVRRMERGIE